MTDGAEFIVQIAATVFTVALGFWRVHEKLRDRIDKVKEDTGSAKQEIVGLKGSIDVLGQKVDNFTNLCSIHRGALGDRIERLEKREA